MKKILLLILLISVFFNYAATAQETIISDVNHDLLQKYIQLAKDYYPQRKILEKRAEAAKTAIPAATVSYFDIFTVSYIYRPSNDVALASPGVSANPYAVNGFQLGASFSLGTYLQKPFAAKKARADYDVAKLETEVYDITLATDVKKRYYMYLQQVAQLKIATQSLEDSKTAAENLRYKFEKNEVTLEVYNVSRASQTAVTTAKLQTEVNYLVAKDALEEIIGKRLEDVQ